MSLKSRWPLGVALILAVVSISFMILRSKQILFSGLINSLQFEPLLLQSDSCAIGGPGRMVRGSASSFEARLKVPLYRGGYDPFEPLRRLANVAPVSERVSSVKGNMVLIHDGVAAWILVTFDTIGITGQFSDQVRIELSTQIKRDNPQLRCVLVNSIATHSHSSADLIGLWGGAATSLDSSMNSTRMSEFALSPIVSEIKRTLQLISVRTRSVQFQAREAYFPSSRGPSIQTLRESGVADRFGHQDVFAVEGYSAPDSLFHIWIWNAQAATEPIKRSKVKGDFPESVRARIPIPTLFLPGSLVSEYPVQGAGWIDKLALEITSRDERRLISLPIVIKQMRLCVAVQSRLAPVIDYWARLWGGPGFQRCPDGGPFPGREAAYALLTHLHFPDKDVPDIFFMPWEVSRELALEMEQNWVKGLRVVSLADGFMGHGLADSQWCAIGLKALSPCPEKKVREPALYEALLSMNQNILDVFKVIH